MWLEFRDVGTRLPAPPLWQRKHGLLLLCKCANFRNLGKIVKKKLENEPNHQNNNLYSTIFLFKQNRAGAHRGGIFFMSREDRRCYPLTSMTFPRGIIARWTYPVIREEPTDVPSEHRSCNDKIVSKAKKQFSGPDALAISTLRW